jgi:hypothetical protein
MQHRCDGKIDVRSSGGLGDEMGDLDQVVHIGLAGLALAKRVVQT